MLCLIKHLSPQVRCQCHRQMWWPWVSKVQLWCLNGRSCLIGHHLGNHLPCTTNPSTPSDTRGWLWFLTCREFVVSTFSFWGRVHWWLYIYAYHFDCQVDILMLIMCSTASSCIFAGCNTIEELVLWCWFVGHALCVSKIQHACCAGHYLSSSFFPLSFFLLSGSVLQSSFL